MLFSRHFSKIYRIVYIRSTITLWIMMMQFYRISIFIERSTTSIHSFHILRTKFISTFRGSVSIFLVSGSYNIPTRSASIR